MTDAQPQPKSFNKTPAVRGLTFKVTRQAQSARHKVHELLRTRGQTQLKDETNEEALITYKRF